MLNYCKQKVALLLIPIHPNDTCSCFIGLELNHYISGTAIRDCYKHFRYTNCRDLVQFYEKTKEQNDPLLDILFVVVFLRIQKYTHNCLVDAVFNLQKWNFKIK